MTLHLQTQSRLCLRHNHLEVSLATTFAEVDAARRLRFEVFNLELHEGLSASYEHGIDCDAFDAWCDHLIVRDLQTETVVGTYRLLRGSVARCNLGFYSANEFDLTNLQNLHGETLELGRSCVARSHRSFATINLLWQAITQYATQYKVEYLFGCASLHEAGAHEIAPLYAYLRRHHFAPAALRVTPHEANRMPLVETLAEQTNDTLNERAALRALPPLVKGYLRAGALVCGAPAFDPEFGTADLFVLLRTAQMAARYQQHYSAEVTAQ